MNIDLGSFNWDISKIEAQIIENRKQLEQYSAALALNKKALNDEKKEIQELGMKVAAMQAVQREANQQLHAGIISQEDYAKTISESNAAIDEAKQKSIEIAAAQSAHIKTIIDTENAMKELRLENTELNKLMSAGRTEVSGNEGAYRELNKELNALKTEAKNLGAEMVVLKRAGKENTEEYRELEAEWKRVSAEADALNDDFKQLDSAVGDNQRNVGNYKEAFTDAFSEIRNGASSMMSGDVKGGFETIKGGFSGIKSGALDLLNTLKANPWILVITGIAAFVKEMWEYNAQTKELNQTVEQIANTSGAATDELRKSATALSETYGGEFTDRVAELNSLMTDFGLTASQAFDTYNAGLAAGGALNSEFADSIREYGPLFAQSGYSAQDFLNILNSGIDLGVYSDKLPDAIKEAGLSLKENTKATRDALVNAFGASFSDEILTKVSSGSITVKQALDEIAAKAKTAHLNEQQLAQLTADVFKGAGEDAGGALKIFEAINHAQDINKNNLTDLQQATLELANKNRELEDAKEDAFKSDVVMSFQQDVIGIWKDIQIWWYRSLDDITGFLQGAVNGWRLAFMNARDFIALVPQAFRSVIGGMKADFQNLGEIARAFGAVIKSALSFDVAGVEANFSNLLNRVRSFQSQTKAELGKVGAELGTGGNINQRNVAKIEAQNTARANKQREENAASTKNTKVTGASGDAAAKAAADAKKSADARVREAERYAKEQERIRKEQQQKAEQAARDALKIAQDNAQRSIDSAKNELAEYIAVNAKKFESDKWLNEQRWHAQLDYYEKIWALKQEELRKEEEKALIGVTNEQDRLNIQKDFATKRLENDNEYQEKSSEITTRYRDQQAEQEKLYRATEYQNKILDMEANNASEFEIQQAKLDNDTQQKLDQFLKENELLRQSDQENYDINSEIDLQRQELENQIADTKDEDEKIRLQTKLGQMNEIQKQYAADTEAIDKATTDAKLSAYSAAFGGIADLVGEGTALGRAAGIAETTINTYKAAQAAYAAGASLGGPLGAVMGPVLAGIAVAAGLRNVAKIAGIGGTKKKAARGMLITGNSHANGGVPISTPSGMIEAEGGEVIINKVSSAIFRDQLSDINAAGGGVRFARGGVVPSNLASVQKTITVSQDYSVMAAMMADAVATGAARGTYSGSQSGISDLSTNKAIAEGANF